jgi:site-specific DNA-methyltransferase (adenine-specific)
MGVMDRVEIGDAVLYRGDALEIMRELEPGSVGLTLVDPPYSSGGMFRSDRVRPTGEKYVQTEQYQAGRCMANFQGDDRDQRAWTAWCERWLSLAYDLSAPGGGLLCFIDWRQLPALTDAVQIARWSWRGVAVWDKTQAARPVKGWHRQQAEFLVSAACGPLRAGREGLYLPGVFRYAPLSGGVKLHQTGKPEPLMADLVLLSDPGAVVADYFMGSGTTGIAALRAGRRFIGIELDPRYFEVACRRIEAEREALKRGGGA